MTAEQEADAREFGRGIGQLARAEIEQIALRIASVEKRDADLHGVKVRLSKAINARAVAMMLDGLSRDDLKAWTRLAVEAAGAELRT